MINAWPFAQHVCKYHIIFHIQIKQFDVNYMKAYFPIVARIHAHSHIRIIAVVGEMCVNPSYFSF